MDQRRFEARERARELAREGLARGAPLSWFERLYEEARGDESRVPWADAEGHPLLIGWLAERAPPEARRRALVVGCGLGEDAECLAQAGYEVTAFDVAPTAVEWCRRRHPRSSVRYLEADLFALPREWARSFDLVFECYTLQALPLELRGPACAALAGCVAANGAVLVITRGREPHEDPGQLPWPLTRAEVDELGGFGLQRAEFEQHDSGTPELPVRHFRALYERRT